MTYRQHRQQASRRRRPAAAPDPEPASNVVTVEAALDAALQHHQSGRLRDAEAIYRKVLEVRPRNPVALHHLGLIALHAGQNETAVDLVARAIAIRPGYAEAHNNLGFALMNQGKLEQAVVRYQKAISLKPGYTEAHGNLYSALLGLRKYDEAVAACEKAIAVDAGRAEAHNNMGFARMKQGRHDEAAACFQEAISLKPDFSEAHNNLGSALKLQGRLDRAVASYRIAAALRPNFAMAHSNLLYNLQYLPGLTLEEMFAEYRRWNDRHAAPLAGEIVPHANVRDPDRRIRVGFVSATFQRHPVGYLITPALEARDGAAWELYCYSSGGRRDDLTERIRAAADVWREIGGIDDDGVARLVRDDEIDILVDLIGHVGGNRFLVFARKPAPVQVKWVGGQVNTTGLDAIDYFLSDSIETPEGAEKWFSEEVIRLPDGYACYAPPAYAPEVGPLPALKRGHVTFGCFNKLAKINGKVVALWARLLHRLPTARLVLKTRLMGDAGVRERYHAMFEEHGVDKERIDLLAKSPHAEFLAHYGKIDVALDPIPWSGCLTTYESLWMGVPVITLPGETFAGRHSASHLHNVGLGDWVVGTEEEYLALAERWSRDVAALADLRAGLRARMAVSPLCDGPRFARNLEAAFRAMWRRWCDESAPRQPGRDR